MNEMKDHIKLWFGIVGVDALSFVLCFDMNSICKSAHIQSTMQVVGVLC
jgi:hypothetical protein